MLNFKVINDGKFTDCAEQDFTQSKGVKVLFLGGLLHFNGRGFGYGLSSILTELTGSIDTQTSIFSCHRSKDDVGETAGHMYSFVQEGAITQEAHYLFERLILPQELKQKLLSQPVAASKDLKEHLSSIRIIGYSYGTSLVQQIERLCTSFIQESGLDEVPDVIGAFSELRALNIGPVAHIHDSQGNRFGAERLDLDNAESLFSQLFFYKHNDKIMQDCLSDDLVRPLRLKEGQAYQAIGNHKTGYICDLIGEDYICRIGKSRFASGVETVKVDHKLDFESHDLRLYTNTLRVADDMATYPSTATAEILHDASKHLVKAPTAQDYICSSLKTAQDPFAHDERKDRILSAQSDFNNAVDAFRKTPYAQTSKFVTSHLNALKRRLNMG